MNRFDEEERLAIERIGKDRNAIKWLLKLSQVDPQNISKGTLEDLAWEIRVFAIYGWLDEELPPYLESNVSLQHPPAIYLKEWHNQLKNTPENIKKIQSLVTSWIEALLRKDPSPPITATLRFSVVSDTKGQGVLKIRGEKSLLDSFTYYALSLLAHFSPMIRRCSECQTIFFAERSKQNYCSSRCLGRFHQRKRRQYIKTIKAKESQDGQKRRKR